MIRKAVISSQVLSGLRTRYAPRSRIGQGLISVAPWLNLVLLLVFFAMVESKTLLVPGAVVRLPKMPFRDGTPPGMTAVALSIGQPGGSREEVIIFDDERFQVKSAEQMRRLRETLADRVRRHGDVPLVLLADERMNHGTVVKIMDMAREAGVREVNIAAREAGPASVQNVATNQ